MDSVLILALLVLPSLAALINLDDYQADRDYLASLD